MVHLSEPESEKKDIVTLGIGCRRGIPAAQIRETVFEILEKEKLDPADIKQIATIDLKINEEGLLNFAKEMDLPILFFSAKELAAVEDHWGFAESDFVRQSVGVGNVCERAAVAGGGELIVRKYAKNGVTVAAARRK